MAIKGLILDLYGTLFREDEGQMLDVCRQVMNASPMVFQVGDVARFWWSVTSECYESFYGKDFMDMRNLDINTLQETIEHFEAKVQAKDLLVPIFRDRLAPALFDDSRLFMGRLPLPSVVIANGDRADVDKALATTQLPVTKVITSEDVKSYKPRLDIFRAALAELGLVPDEVLMVGDSLHYDLAPAKTLGIHTAWVNRSRRALNGAEAPDLIVSSLSQLRAMMTKNK